jgi:hypothetical protein
MARTSFRCRRFRICREAHQLIEAINEARELGVSRKLRAQFHAADLPTIDDLFLRKLPARAGAEPADVLMSRCEKGAAIITSNRPLDDWRRPLGDVVVVTPFGIDVDHRPGDLGDAQGLS